MKISNELISFKPIFYVPMFHVSNVQESYELYPFSPKFSTIKVPSEDLILQI